MCVEVPYCFVTLRNLSLDGKLCLHDDRNAAYMCSPSLAVENKHGLPHAFSDTLSLIG